MLLEVNWYNLPPTSSTNLAEPTPARQRHHLLPQGLEDCGGDEWKWWWWWYEWKWYTSGDGSSDMSENDPGVRGGNVWWYESVNGGEGGGDSEKECINGSHVSEGRTLVVVMRVKLTVLWGVMWARVKVYYELVVVMRWRLLWNINGVKDDIYNGRTVTMEADVDRWCYLMVLVV